MNEEQLKEFLKHQVDINHEVREQLKNLYDLLIAQDKRIKELESKS